MAKKKKGYMIMKFVGNVDVWREILGYEEKFCLSVQKSIANCRKITSFPGGHGEGQG